MLQDLFGIFEELKIQMPADYLRKDIVLEMISVIRQAQFDVSITFGLCGSTGATCGEVMRKLSPIWKETVSTETSPENRMQLFLENADRASFEKMLSLACGQSVQVCGLGEIMGIWSIARCYKVQYVFEFLCKQVLSMASDDILIELLAFWLSPSDGELYYACYDLALRRFDSFAKKPGLVNLSHSLLSSLLDDERLVSESEVRVFEAVACWIKQNHDEQLLRKIRFNLLPPAFLDANARVLLPNSTLLPQLIERLRAVQQPARLEKPLAWSWPWYCGWGGPSVFMADRIGSKYVAGAVGLASVFLGTDSGEVHQFNHKGCCLTIFKDVPLSTKRNSITCLAIWGGKLVCAYEDTHVKVWNVTSREVVEITRQQTTAWPEAGELTNTLIPSRTEFSPPPRKFISCAADGDEVCALVGGRDLLLIGYASVVRVWAADDEEWKCVRSKPLVSPRLRALAWHRDGQRVVCADDSCVRVWDAATGVESLVFDVRDVPIRAMVVHGSMLVALSPTGVLVAWCLETGSLLRSARLRRDEGADPAGGAERMFLAALGRKLVTGVSYRRPAPSFEVSVVGLETLELQGAVWHGPGEAGDLLMTDGAAWLVALCSSRSLVCFSSRGPSVVSSKPFSLDKVVQARRVYVESVAHNAVQAEITDPQGAAMEPYSALRAHSLGKGLDKGQRRRSWVPKWMKRSGEDGKAVGSRTDSWRSKDAQERVLSSEEAEVAGPGPETPP